MAINTALNRDPFATGGVMDAPDKAVTVAMNKIALGMQLTPQELGRLATRQKLEQQSGAVAAQKASFQSLVGQAPIDVRSYKGSMWASANPQEDQANAALEARFGKRAPGQIDISYGAPAGGAPSYTPAYAPTMGLLGQAQESQSDIRAAQAPTNYPAALGGQSYGIGANPIPQTSATGVGYGFAPRPVNAPAQRPSYLATGLGEFGAGATTPMTSSFNPEVFSATPSSSPAAQAPAAPRYMSGFEQAAGAPSMPLGELLSRNKTPVDAGPKPTESTNRGVRLNESIADFIRKGALAVARPFQPENWKPDAGTNVMYEPQQSYLDDLKYRYAQLEDKGSPTAVQIKREISALSPRKQTVDSMAGNLMKLPGAIGTAPQATGAAEAQPGRQMGSGPLAIDGYSSAGASNPPLSESVSADGTPFSAQVPAAPSPAISQLERDMAVEAQPADAEVAPAAPVDNRPTRIYAFGGGEPIGQSPIQQAKGERVKPLETSFDKALAASPKGRAAAVAEARFQNTLEQQAKKERDALQKKFMGSVSDALALDPNVDISSLSKSQQNEARLQAEISRKKAGLDDKDNNAAYGKAMEESANVPAGPQKVAAMIASYISNNGKVTPDMVKKMQDLAGAPVEVTELPGMTVVRAGNTVRILDEKLKPFDVNRMEKDRYSDLVIDSAGKYESWDSLPADLKGAFIRLNRQYPEKDDAGMTMDVRKIWEKTRELIVPAPPAPRAPQAVRPGQARPATKPSVPAAKPPPGFSIQP